MTKKIKVLLMICMLSLSIGLSVFGGVFALSNIGMNVNGGISFGRDSYPLTLQENGGVYINGYTEPTTYTYSGTTATNLPTDANMYKRGYTLSGWSKNSDLSGSTFTSIAAKSRGPKTFYAKYSENSYTITANASGGEIVDMVPNVANFTHTDVKGNSTTFAWTEPHVLSLNGTIATDSGSVSTKSQEVKGLTFKAGQKLVYKVTLLSGTITTTNNTVIVLEVTKGSSTSNLSTRVHADLSLSTLSQQKSVTKVLEMTEEAETSGNGIKLFTWHAANTSVTFNNAKLKIEIGYEVAEDGSTATQNYTVNSGELALPIAKRTGFAFNGWTEKYTFTASDWNAGFINSSTGAFEYNSSYSTAYFTDALLLTKGVTYTLSGGLNDARFRYYSTSGTYLGTASGLTFTPTEDCLTHILYYQSSTEAQRTSTVLTASGTAASIPTSSIGNRTYTANWSAQDLTFNDQTLANGAYGSSYNQSFTGASGGTGNYSYTITSVKVGGSASSASAAGLAISGTAITSTSLKLAGAIAVTVQAKDNTSGATASAVMTFTVTTSAPASLAWSTSTQGTATWGAVSGATGYSITLYNGSTAVKTVTATTTSYAFLSDLNGLASAGALTFRVKATAGGYTSSETNSTSNANHGILYQIKYIRNHTTSDTTVHARQYFTAAQQTVQYATAPTKTGYDFAGWYTEAACTNLFTFAQVARETGSVVLYANWTGTEYTVVLKPNGGSGADIEKSVNYYKTVTNTSVHSYTGYVLNGYYTNSTGGTKIFNADGSVVASVEGYTNSSKQWIRLGGVTLYAQWSAGTVNYKVEHYKENLDGTYTLGETENKTGTTGNTATASYKTYTGFNSYADHASTIASGTIKADGSLVLKLYYNRIQYRIEAVAGTGISAVSLKVNSGNVTQCADAGYFVRHGASVTIGATVSSGYTWSTWTATGTAPSAFAPKTQTQTFTVDAGDSVLTASAKGNSYTITMDNNGGSGGAVSPATYTISTSSQTVTLTKPTRTGYTLTSWSVTGATGGTPTASGTTLTIPANTYGNLTVKANWTAVNYTITVDSNGGSGGASSKSTYNISASAQTATLTKPTRTGYTFKDWTVTGATSGSPSASGTTLTIPANTYGNLTVKANWTAVNYTITYNLNGGTADGNYPTSFTYSSTLNETLTNPTKTGYEFNGWTSSNNKVDITEGDKDTYEILIAANTIAENITLTANWTANSYTITVNSNGGTGGAVNTATYSTSTSSQTRTLTKPTRAGYTFKDWTVSWTDSTHSSTLPTISGTTLTIPANTYGNLTVKANWTANSYTITYNLNGGTAGGNYPTSFTYSSTLYETLTKPTKTGYEFNGWTSSNNKVDITEGDKDTYEILIAAGTIAENITLTANWTAKSYTITVNSNGGTGGAVNTASYSTSTSSQTRTLTKPTRANYVFDSWTVTGATSGSPTASGTTLTIPANTYGNLTVKANWVEAEAKIGTTYYATLEDALDAANAKDVVTILKNCTIDKVYTLDKSLIITSEKQVTVYRADTSGLFVFNLDPYEGVYFDGQITFDTSVTLSSDGESFFLIYSEGGEGNKGFVDFGEGIKILNGRGSNGSAISIKGGQVGFSGKISECYTDAIGGAVYVTEGRFELTEGGIIQGCSTKSKGGAIYAQSSSTIQIDGTIEGCTANGNGGAVYLESSLLILNSTGTIKECFTHGRGGAIYCFDGQLKIEGTIDYCESVGSGGGIHAIQTAVKVTGTILGCTVYEGSGGAIYLSSCELTLNGATITDNTASDSGDCIYVEAIGGTDGASPAIMIDGDATKVEGEIWIAESNYPEGVDSIIYVAANTQLGDCTLRFESDPPIDYPIITFADEDLYNSLKDYYKALCPLSGQYGLVEDPDNLALVWGIAAVAVNTTTDTYYLTLKAAIESVTSGNANIDLLVEDIPVSETITVASGVSIMIDVADGSMTPNVYKTVQCKMFVVNGSLDVQAGITFDGKELTAGTDTPLFEVSGTLSTYDVEFINNNSNTAAIVLKDGATLSLESGSVSYNQSTADIGGAIFARATGLNISLSGVEFNKNSINSYHSQGGALYVHCSDEDSSITLDGCKFIGNVVQADVEEARGGAIYIYLDGGTAAIDECEFDGNMAIGKTSAQGGAIYCAYANGNTTINMTNAIFKDNVANASEGAYGGAIYAGGKMQIQNSVFTSNTANKDTTNSTTQNYYGYGGAISIYSDMTLIDCIFSSNQAGYNNGYGGALHIAGSVIVTDSSTYEANNFARYGNIVYIQEGAKYQGESNTTRPTLNGGPGESSLGYYGVVYVNNSTNNQAKLANININVSYTGSGYGGGIHKTGAGLFFLDNVTISIQSGTNVEYGGGVYLNDGEIDTFNLVVENGNARLGGAVYISKGTFTLGSGSTIAGDGQSGGAVYISNSTDAKFVLNGGTISSGQVYIAGAHEKAFTYKSGTLTSGSVSIYQAWTNTDLTYGSVYVEGTISTSIKVEAYGTLYTGYIFAEFASATVMKNNSSKVTNSIYSISNREVKVGYNTIKYFASMFSTTSTGYISDNMSSFTNFADTTLDSFSYCGIPYKLPTFEELGLTQRYGYKPVSYNTKADGSGNTLNPGSSFTIGGQINTAYVIWEKVADYYEARIGDTYYETLSTAISAAKNGDTIYIWTDILLNYAAIDKSITIMSEATSADNPVYIYRASANAVDLFEIYGEIDVTFDGYITFDTGVELSTDDQYQSFFYISEHANVTFGEGIIIQNGCTESGGAINIDNAELTFNGTIQNCSASRGGAIYCYEATVIINGTIQDCTASWGGGIYDTNGTITLNGTISGCSQLVEGSERHGGAIANIDGDLTINGTIINCHADNNGGAIGMYGGTLNITADGVITECTALSGGGVYVDSCDEFILAGEISLCEAYVDGGGIFSYSNVQITETGAIAFCDAGYAGGGGIYINDAQLLVDGIISGCGCNSEDGFGGGIHAEHSAVWINGSIEECSAEAGGGMYITNNTSVTITGAIVDCFSGESCGGAIYSDFTCVIEINGANMTGNGSGDVGSLIYFNTEDEDFVFNKTNIRITGGMSEVSGELCYNLPWVNEDLDGDGVQEQVVLISCQAITSFSENFYISFPWENFMEWGSSTENTFVPVMFKSQTIAEATYANMQGNKLLGSWQEDYVLKYNYGVDGYYAMLLDLTEEVILTYNNGGGAITGSFDELSSYFSTNKLGISSEQVIGIMAKRIYLNKTYTLGNQYLHMTEWNDVGRHTIYNISTGTMFNITKSISFGGDAGLGFDGAGSIKTYNPYDSLITVNASGYTVTFQNGFDGIYNTVGSAGAIYANSGTVNVYCTIENCLAYYGPAVYNNGATVNIGTTEGYNQAYLINNTAKYGGGALYNNAGTMNINYAQIYGNEVTSGDGGGLYIYTGTVTFTQGSIGISGAGNTAINGRGGGVYLYSGSFTMSGDSSYIAYNTAGSNGGGVAMNVANYSSGGSAAFYFNGGYIERNQAGSSGGGISNYMGNLHFNSEDSKYIRYNTAGTGGGIHSNTTSNFGNIMKYVEISNNTADYGGGIFHMDSNNLQMGASITITKNTANIEGGGIYNAAGTVSLTSSININQNYGLGNGIFNEGGNINISSADATITGNGACSAVLYNKGTVYMTNGTIGISVRNVMVGNRPVNTVPGSGRTVVNEGTFNLTTGTITNSPSRASTLSDVINCAVYNTGTFTQNSGTVVSRIHHAVYTIGRYNLYGGTVTNSYSLATIYIKNDSGGRLHLKGIPSIVNSYTEWQAENIATETITTIQSDAPLVIDGNYTISNLRFPMVHGDGTNWFYAIYNPNRYTITADQNVGDGDINSNFYGYANYSSASSTTAISLGGDGCFTVDTEITVWDDKKKRLRKKKAKDITYKDKILVWNFDKGCFDFAHALFIQKEEVWDKYTEVGLSDGSVFKVVKEHSVYSVDKKGFRPILSNNPNWGMPIGSRVFKEDGTIATIVYKKEIKKTVEYTNIITNYHMNVFTSGMLTSTPLNNCYFIDDNMKFIKEDTRCKNMSLLEGVSEEWIKGLRLDEKPDYALLKILSSCPGAKTMKDWLEINKLSLQKPREE